MPDAILNILLELAPWLLLGAVVAGMLHIVIPADWLRRHLSGNRGVIKAVAFGVPLPLCSCGVIPVGLGLKRDGASDGAVVGFLISTPQTGVDSILVSATFLGLPFALFKVAAALVTGLIGGWLTSLTGNEASSTPATRATRETASRGFRGGLDHAVMLIRSIWRWLVVGIVISALITWLIPDGSLSAYPMTQGLPGLLLSLLISLPLYVCATASVPIAASLVASGLPVGSALVFLMAGPATNIATLGAVYRTLGRRSLFIYLGTIVTGSLVAGLLFQSLFDPQVVTAHLHHEHTAGWWRMASAGILLCLLAWFGMDDMRRWLRRRTVSSTPSAVTLTVTGMTCNGCAARLERLLNSTDGIDSAAVSYERSEAQVTGVCPKSGVAEVIRAAGFEVAENKP